MLCIEKAQRPYECGAPCGVGVATTLRDASHVAAPSLEDR